MNHMLTHCLGTVILMSTSKHLSQRSNVFFVFFKYLMSGKGRRAYKKAPTKERLRKWEKVQ